MADKEGEEWGSHRLAVFYVMCVWTGPRKESPEGLHWPWISGDASPGTKEGRGREKEGGGRGEPEEGSTNFLFMVREVISDMGSFEQRQKEWKEEAV